ncbi:MAG TPA: ABC transporter permease [Streptosporangiaceae bacterium]|nr:ABC transporter permease [Streptosporangiaceae bacterium]
MQAVVRVAAGSLRARRRGWVLIAALVAVGGCAVLASAAGARRTSSAYPRFLRVSKAAQVFVSPGGTGLGGYYRALARLPGVTEIAPGVGLNIELSGANRPSVAVEAPVDGRLWRQAEIPKILAGRLPPLGRPGEVAVDQNGAALLHLHVGSTLALTAAGNTGSPGAAGSRPGQERGLTERVVGIVVTPQSVDPVTDIDKIPLILATPALWHRLGPAYRAYDAAYVRLRPGATASGFGRRAQALARRFPATQGQIYVDDASTQAAAVQQAVRPEALALALFALVLAITTLLIVGQAAVRQLAASLADTPTLAALGMTREQMMAAGLACLGAAAAAGAVAAAGLSVAVSPLMPIGTARLAEPDPGVSADWTVLGTGAVALVVLLVAGATWPAWRFASARLATVGEDGARPGARSGLGIWLGRAGAPVTATLGARFALDRGGGRTAVPVRGALAGTALSVMAVTAAFTFGASLLQLVHSPVRYGQRWDAVIDLQFSALTRPQADRLIGRDPGVSGWSLGDHGIIGVNGAVIPAIGVTTGRGPLMSPTLLQGRPPRSAHELVLGTSTLRRLGLRVGEPVTVAIGGLRLRDRIVGRAVFPNFGEGGYAPTDLGVGAETTTAVLQRQVQPDGPATGSPAYEFMLLRMRPGQRGAAGAARLQRSMAAFCRSVQQSTCVVTDQRPDGVTNYARIDGIPEALALLLAVLGVAVLGQLMVVSGWRRRRDIAMLKALGLVRQQIRAIVAWQVTTLTGIALLAGLPLGVAVGRWAWALFSGSLGVPPGAAVPVPFVLLMIPAAILAGYTAAWWPARAAARLSPARVLRAE